VRSALDELVDPPAEPKRPQKVKQKARLIR
jgi:hypothetical protein